MMGRTSPIASPTATVCRVRCFRFAFYDGRTAAVKAQRRRAVAEHLDGWAGASIIRERQDGGRCWVTVALERPITVAATQDMARECPRYVPGTVQPVLGDECRLTTPRVRAV